MAEKQPPPVDRAWLLVTGVLLVTMPAVTLLVAYVAINATRSVVQRRITLVEAAELYLIELAAFALFSYLFYRVTLYSLRSREGAEDQGEAVDGEQPTSGSAR
jgi:hypothetical protein